MQGDRESHGRVTGKRVSHYQTGGVRVVGSSFPATKRVAVGDDVSRCAGKKGRLFGRGARAGATGATDWTAGTTLPAPLAITGPPFWPSGVLAPLPVRNADCGLRNGGEARVRPPDATSKPPQSHLIAKGLRPQSYPKATLKPPTCDPIGRASG